MPFFRKACVLTDFGWDFSSGLGLFSRSLVDEPEQVMRQKDTKVIPLFASHVTRGSLDNNSTEFESGRISSRIIQITSPDKKDSLVLRAPNDNQTSAWFSAIVSCICTLNAKAIVGLNQVVVDTLDGAAIQYLGWLTDMSCARSPTISRSPLDNSCSRTFVVVTDRDILLFSKVPWTRDEWLSPSDSFSLLHVRFIPNSCSPVSSSDMSSSSPSSSITPPSGTSFSLRIGTQSGIQYKFFRTETQSDLTVWAKFIVKGSHDVAMSTREVAFGM